MTIPIEEVWALKNAKRFLQEINEMNLTEFRKKASYVRKESCARLRHYPFQFYTDKLLADYEQYRHIIDLTREFFQTNITSYCKDIVSRRRAIKMLVEYLVSEFPPNDFIDDIWKERVDGTV